jgi:hypothetical protein
MRPAMNRESLEPSPEGGGRPLRQVSKATGVAVISFVLAVGFMRANHPLLLTRHLDRVLEQCGGVALAAFVTAWFIYSVKNSEG